MRRMTMAAWVGVLTCIAMSAAAAPGGPSAVERQYGDPGVIEIGGTVGFSSSADKQAGAGITLHDSALQFSPQIGYFLSDGLEVEGLLNYQSGKSSYGGNPGSITHSLLGVGVGGGYFFKVGANGMRV